MEKKDKILVVDDESRMRKLIGDFLLTNNFEVLEAADGEEALKIFNNQQQSMLESIQETNDMLDMLKFTSPDAYEYAIEKLAEEEEENEDETSP